MRTILKIAVAFMLLLTIGCSKSYLEPVPKTSLSDLSVFENKDRIMAQVNGMYAAVKVGNYLGGRYLAIGDLRGENWVPLSNNIFVLFHAWQQNEGADDQEVKDTWGAIYAAVNIINVFMDGLKTNWDAGNLNGKITQEEYDQFTSEALTLRAMCYLDLIRLYAKPYIQGSGSNLGVPLRVKAEKAAGGNDLARSTVAEVYTQILDDLNAAEPLAIDDYGDDVLNTTRIHKNTIIALKTRALLSKTDWAGVLTESAKIVPAAAPYVAPSGVPNRLIADWSSIWTTNTSKESIFALPNTALSNGGTQSAITWYFASTGNEANYLASATPVYAAMDPADIRRSSMIRIVPATPQDPGDSVRHFVAKYTQLTTLADWSPIMRYAEVLLSRSEALVRNGGSVTQEAVDLLNAVRTRAFPAGGFTLASFATPEDFYTAILQERNFEFLGEGVRSFDLMRLGLDIPAKDGLVQGKIAAVSASSTSYYFPMPATELSVNKLCVP